jgi:hypothetical protein
MAAKLLRAGLVKIEEMYVHLGGTDEKETQRAFHTYDIILSFTHDFI